MKIRHYILGAAAALIGAGFAADALAADFPPLARQPLAPQPLFYDWSGFYVGANIGHAWGDATLTVPGVGSASESYDGIIGGGQIGANWQNGRFVFGVEADIQATGISDRATIPGFVTMTSDVDWLATVRGRAGGTFNGFLAYATGGFAVAKNKIVFNFGGPTVSDSNTHTGWTIGGGLEAAMSDNWSVKGEYLFVDLGKETYFPGALGGFQVETEFHILRIGANYRIPVF